MLNIITHSIPLDLFLHRRGMQYHIWLILSVLWCITFNMIEWQGLSEQTNFFWFINNCNIAVCFIKTIFIHILKWLPALYAGRSSCSYHLKIEEVRIACTFSLVLVLKSSSSHMITQLVKNPPAMREIWVRSLGWEDSLEKGKATLSNILAWRIPWTVYSTGVQRVGLDWANFTFTAPLTSA